MNLNINGKSYPIYSLSFIETHLFWGKSLDLFLTLEENKEIYFVFTLVKRESEEKFKPNPFSMAIQRVEKSSNLDYITCPLCDTKISKRDITGSKCSYLKLHEADVIRQLFNHPSIRLKSLSYKNYIDYESFKQNQK